MKRYDLLIVGAGVAGMSAAYRFAQLRPELKIAMVTLQKPGTAGSTPWAQGGIAVAWSRDDSPRLHAQDTIAAGAGLCRPEAVEVLTQEGPARIQQLLDLGACFDRGPDGDLQLTREAAHQRHRVVHGGDSSGRALARALAEALPGQIEVIVGQVTQLLRQAGRVVGIQLNGQALISADQVVLATGGVGQLFAATTNPEGAEGQGLALAFEAGASLRDLEFIQFHPTALAVPVRGARLPLLTEALRGEGARLVDETGRTFMQEYHAAADLAPRDVVAFAIWQHRQKGHQTFLDARSLPVAERFQQVHQLCQASGFDPATQPLPVTPAVHYHMGGIEVDLWGRTTVPGLWACGEVASTGVHGANRLASNSLLEGLVFGDRLGRAVAEEDFSGKPHLWTGVQNRPLREDPLGMARLREILWSGLGLARSRAGLELAQRNLERLRLRLQSAGSSAALVADLMLRSAAFRQESRGAHRRLDYPQSSPAWEGQTQVLPRQPLVLQDLGPVGHSVYPVGNDVVCSPV